MTWLLFLGSRIVTLTWVNFRFKDCNCDLGCKLIAQRRRIMADQGQLRRREEELQSGRQMDDLHSGLRKGK